MSNKAIDLVTKLKAQAESAEKIGNIEEAQAFTEKMLELMIKYKIEETDLCIDELPVITIDRDYYDPSDAGLKRGAKRCHWLELLAMYVCDANMCKCLVHKGTNVLSIIGSESSRSICSYLISTLARSANKICEDTYRKKYYKHKKNGTEYEMKGWKRSFMQGFCIAIGQRYQEDNLHDRMAKNSERGLVLVNAELEALNNHLASIGLVKASSLGGCRNHDGYNKGKENGNKANIKANGVGGPSVRKIK